jgi:bifunctional non-homologous end joining protein LigD
MLVFVHLAPMRLLRIPEAFDHPDFIFEPKIDGFRALAYVEGNRCTLVSRNDNVFKSWPQLAEEIAHAVRADSAVLDGEICCLDPDGCSNFKNLLFRRERPYFYAFDLLALDGHDLRTLPLLQRKRRLLQILPKVESRVMYVDHVPKRGVDLFAAACRRDLEGIVAKWAHGSYNADGRATSWLKIKHPEYSQMDGRRELFEERRNHAPRRDTKVAPELRLA